MKLKFTILTALLIVSCLDQHTTEAGGHHKVQLRAYRRMMRTEYPSPFAVFLGNVLTDQLQRDGSQFNQLTQVFADLLKGQFGAGAIDGGLVARSTPISDPHLSEAQARLQRVCEKMDIPYVKLDATVPTSGDDQDPPSNTGTGQGLDNAPLDGLSPTIFN